MSDHHRPGPLDVVALICAAQDRVRRVGRHDHRGPNPCPVCGGHRGKPLPEPTRQEPTL